MLKEGQLFSRDLSNLIHCQVIIVYNRTSSSFQLFNQQLKDESKYLYDEKKHSRIDKRPILEKGSCIAGPDPTVIMDLQLWFTTMTVLQFICSAKSEIKASRNINKR